MLMSLPVRQIRVCSCAIAVAALLCAACGRDKPEPVANTPTPVPTATPEAAEEVEEVAALTAEEMQKIVDEETAKWKAERAKATPVPRAQPAGPTVAAPREAKGKTYKELIIGKWQVTDANSTMTIEFNSDGTLTGTEKRGEREHTMAGSYRWESANTLVLTMKGPDGQTHEVTQTVDSLDEDSLTITEDGHTGTLTRVTD